MKSTLRAAITWENILWSSLIVFIGIVGLIAPRFLTIANLTLILYSSAVLGIVAIAETIVILSGGIDISVGAILAISASAISELVRNGCPALLAVLRTDKRYSDGLSAHTADYRHTGNVKSISRRYRHRGWGAGY